jgi:hypothetical protein
MPTPIGNFCIVWLRSSLSVWPLRYGLLARDRRRAASLPWYLLPEGSRAPLLVAIIALFLAVLLHVGPARAHLVNSLRITDHQGSTEVLTDPFLWFSDRYPQLRKEDSFAQYIEVRLPDAPPRARWIHHSQVKEVVFDGKRLRVVTDDGSVHTGSLPPGALTWIGGKGSLGDMKYEISKVRSIEFIDFKESFSDKAISSRESYGQRWRANRSREKALRTCTVADGGQVVLRAASFQIRDSFDADYTILHRALGGGYPWRFSTLNDAVQVEKSSAELTLPLSQVNILAITGRLLDRKPEASIRRESGVEVTLPLLMKTHNKYTGPDEYGTFDPDDAIVVPTGYGYEGLLLSPLRPVIVQCERKR